MKFIVFFFFFNDTATTEIYTLSLHDALPIFPALWHWKHLLSSVSLPGASGNPGACGFCCASAARDRSNAPSRASRTLDERHKIVFTDALQHEESRRTLPAIGDEMRAAGLDRVGIAGREPDLLLGIAQEEPQVSLQHVERVLDMVVIGLRGDGWHL